MQSHDLNAAIEANDDKPEADCILPAGWTFNLPSALTGLSGATAHP